MSPPVDAPPSIYDESGKMLEESVAAHQASLVWETVEEATQYSKDNCSTIPPHLSLMDFFKKRLRERKLDDAATKQILQIALVWGDIVGEPIETQSLKYFWLEECVGGGMYLTPHLFSKSLSSCTHCIQKTSFWLGPIKRYSTSLPSPHWQMSTSN